MCLTSFTKEEKLTKHYENDCWKVVTELPSPGSVMKFDRPQNELKAPFVVYADFEAILEPILGCNTDPSLSGTTQTHRHKASSCAYFIKCSFDSNLDEMKTFHGPDAVQSFVDNLLHDVTRLYQTHVYQRSVELIMSATDWTHYNSVTHCPFCKREFSETVIKVKDHDHRTGTFRLVLHYFFVYMCFESVDIICFCYLIFQCFKLD